MSKEAKEDFLKWSDTYSLKVMKIFTMATGLLYP